jgi:DNA mismatch repair protein MutS2
VKAHRLLDAGSAQVLGFEWLRNAVAPVSPYGERLFSELRPFATGEEAAAEARAKLIAATAAALDADHLEAVRAALADMPDAAAAIARASIGDVLDDPNFLELRRFCASIDHIDELLAGLTERSSIANEAVRRVGDALATGRRDEAGFYLADEFDVKLKALRDRLAREQAELDAARGREIERAARALGRDEIAGNEFIVMRAEIQGGTLPAGVRVVREAPTYLLCELEYGEASLAALERRDAAADAVAQAEEDVRIRLSSLVSENSGGLDAAAAALGELDVLLAGARFAHHHHCTPAAVTKEPELAFEQARFLPLEAELAVAGRRFVPLDLELRDAAVLTGPNMGGKSVCLQTCGFVALCAAFGLPVPAACARTALFDQIAWLGVGREAQAGGLLSSFAREVLELKEILSRDAARLLMLVDEFARTTTPHEGRALLIALLARLRERRVCGMLATHLAGIAGVAGVRHFAVRGLRGIPKHPPTTDVEQALTALAESMDYTIAEVSGDDAPRADAIALTALLGVDRAFVDAAYRALSQ